MQQDNTDQIGEFKTQSGKYNLTVIDRDPEVNNFVYHGLDEKQKECVLLQFLKVDCEWFKFLYDEGEVVINKSCVHTIVFNEYATPEMLEDQEREEAEE